MSAPTVRAAQRGLTMIEVLAAMVIFSTGAVVLFSWITGTADRLNRLGQEQNQLFGELAALEYARSLNPMQQPSGSTKVGDTTVEWQAQPIGEEQRTRGLGGCPVCTWCSCSG